MSIAETIEFLEDVRDNPDPTISTRERLEAAKQLLPLQLNENGEEVPLAAIKVRGLSDRELEAQMEAFGDGGPGGTQDVEDTIAVRVSLATTPLHDRIAKLEAQLRAAGAPVATDTPGERVDWEGDMAAEREAERVANLPPAGTPPPGIDPERGWHRL